MNTASYLCRFLAEHPENWEALLWKDYGIKVKRENTYAIFNYGYDCNFAEPIVQEARGIILDTERLQVVCWPFRKFGNYNEYYADTIDWKTARVFEKLDGSIIKLWFDVEAAHWQFSTNGSIRAENAHIGAFALLTFNDLIRRAENFSNIPFESLDKNYTYIFELISPYNRIVIPYKDTVLCHIGTRCNLSGQEMDIDIGIQKPASYPIKSLTQCIETALALNKNAGEEIIAEGFVVSDGNWNRVKVKSPDYIVKHHLRQTKSLSKSECIAMLLSSPEDAAELCKANPDFVPLFKFYDYHLARLQLSADKLAELSRQLYGEYSRDRAAVASIILRHPLSWIGFRSLDLRLPGREILMSRPIEQLCRHIPDYEAEDFSDLFVQKK